MKSFLYYYLKTFKDIIANQSILTTDPRLRCSCRRCPPPDMSAALTFRPVTRAELPAVVALQADDVLGRGRESAELAP